jgi:hypothetical protein
MLTGRESCTATLAQAISSSSLVAMDCLLIGICENHCQWSWKLPGMQHKLYISTFFACYQPSFCVPKPHLIFLFSSFLVICLLCIVVTKANMWVYQGIWQFMSSKLITQQKWQHDFQDNLESSIYVLLWVMLMYLGCSNGEHVVPFMEGVLILNFMRERVALARQISFKGGPS